MKAKWFGLLMLTTAGVVGGCGEGLLILNVDVYSFVEGSGRDTIPYAIPPLTSNFAVSGTPQRFSLPGGLSCSVVNDVQATGAANMINQTGSGTLRFQLFVAADSLGTFQAAARAVDVGPATVSPSTTTPIAINANLASALNVLFTEPQLWIRPVVEGSNTSAVTTVQGRGVLTAFDLRIVIQDEVC